MAGRCSIREMRARAASGSSSKWGSGASSAVPPGREESKIAQGETLGKGSTERFPPCRGGVNHYSGSPIAVLRNHWRRVAISSRKSHLARNRQGHLNWRTASSAVAAFSDPWRGHSIRPCRSDGPFHCPGLFSIAPYWSNPTVRAWNGRCGGPFKTARRADCRLTGG
jgi:hypothetical protein